MTEEKYGMIDVWCNVRSGVDAEAFKESEQYKVLLFAMQLFRMEDRMRYWTISPEEFIEEFMDPLGIEKVIVPLGQGAGALGSRERRFDLEESAKFIDKYSDRFAAQLMVDPNRGMEVVRELERAVKDYGFKGAHLHPYSIGKPLNDPIYYPIYAKCCELDVPVQTQVGHSAEIMPSKYGQPILLDEVAIYFRELKIIGAHTGWPWVEEMIALAWKHPNVYIGTSAHAPKYWDPSLVRFMNTRGQDKVLFSTDFPVIDHRRAAKEIEELNLREAPKKKLLHDNAVKVFKL